MMFWKCSLLLDQGKQVKSFRQNESASSETINGPPGSKPLLSRRFIFCALENRKPEARDGLPWLTGRLCDAAHGGHIILVIKTS